jgi:hypothetical protein
LTEQRSHFRERGAKDLVNDAGRFFGAGAINTILTLLIYQALLFGMSPVVAYSATWIIGLVFVALVYPTHVFKGGDPSKIAQILTVGVYIIGFGIGLATTKVFSRTLGMDRLAIFVTLIVTSLFNFFAMRLILRRGKNRLFRDG